MLRRTFLTRSTKKPLPDSARVVVVGGGIIGTSVTYHLAHMGVDVVQLERSTITSGTTWHAAGLVGEYAASSETTQMIRRYSKKLYKDLVEETGQETGFRQVGFIELASDKDRFEEFRRISAFNKAQGLEIHEVSPEEIKKMFPHCETSDLYGGFYSPSDGRVNPADVTMALLKGAKKKGAKIFEDTPVETVLRRGNRCNGVITKDGHKIESEFVVNCCGMWARQFAARAGVKVALQAAEHYYLISDTIEGVHRDLPVIEDPGHYGYYREEGGGIMVGLFEPVCAPWMVGGVPEGKDGNWISIEPDWKRLEPFLEKAMKRVPATQTTGIRKLFCGPESFTPDLAPIVGEAPELKNYFVAAGLNSVGILSGGGLGRMLAHWVVNGLPDMDVTGMNIDRIQPYQVNPAFLAERTVESLGQVYACHYPTKQLKTGRNVRLSPIHQRLREAGGEFVEVSGWESPAFYWPENVKQEDRVATLGFNRLNWFDYWRQEHEAARNGVCLVDMSFMCKFSVTGKDAGKTLNWISANNVDNVSNRITYTQWLNEKGCLEADLTVVKLGEDNFFVVATDTALGHVQHHFKKHAPEHVELRDVTSGYAQINIQGPESRALLQAVTDTNMSHEQFPFRRAQHIFVGFAQVLCVRITYMGELGYELYIPSDQAVHVYDTLVSKGKDFGLRHAGLRALGSCRMEKAYRDYGHDLDNCDHICETGLSFCVSMKKPGGFLGKDAVQKYKESSEMGKHKLVQVLCKDPEPFMFHTEPIYRDDKFVGYIRAASYGHTLNGSVGLARISCDGTEFEKADDEFLSTGKWEIEIGLGRRYPCVVSEKPMYDPGNKKILC